MAAQNDISASNLAPCVNIDMGVTAPNTKGNVNCIQIAYYKILSNEKLMNRELEKYNVITAEDILNESGNIFREENSNTLYYYSNN